MTVDVHVSLTHVEESRNTGALKLESSRERI